MKLAILGVKFYIKPSFDITRNFLIAKLLYNYQYIHYLIFKAIKNATFSSEFNTLTEEHVNLSKYQT